MIEEYGELTSNDDVLPEVIFKMWEKYKVEDVSVIGKFYFPIIGFFVKMKKKKNPYAAGSVMNFEIFACGVLSGMFFYKRLLVKSKMGKDKDGK